MSLSTNRPISFSNINQSIQITGGNMGINTSSPAYRLDVNGDIRSSSVIINGDGTYTTGSIYRDSNWGMIVRSGTNNPTLSHFAVADFNDNKLLYISSTNGNVGISTIAPSYRLDVSGSFRATSGDVTLGSALITNANITTLSVGSLALITNTNVTTQTVGTSRITSNLLALGNSNTVGNIFTTGGNVGIGTGSPTYRVDISGSLRSRSTATPGGGVFGEMIFTDPTNGFGGLTIDHKNTYGNDTVLNASSHPLTVITNGSTDFIVTKNSGGVGIRTSNPSYSLDVAGSLRATSGDITLGSALITNTNITTQTVGTSRITTSLLALGNSNTVGNIFTSGGNVGIGTGSPSVRLHVTGGDIGFPYGSSIRVSPESASGWPSGTTKLIEAGWSLNGMGGDVVSIYTPGSINNAARINISSNGAINLNGNVGIGIASPSLRLHVDAGSTTGGNIMLTNSAGGGVVQFNDENHAIWGRIGGDGVANTIQMRSFSQLEFWTGGLLANQTRKMIITSGGNVGIGTGSPSFALDVINTVSSSNAPFLRLGNSGGGAGNQVGIVLAPWSGRSGGASSQIIATDDGNASSHLTFWTAAAGSGTTSAERVRITNSGNLGIGTTSPTTNLHVNGGGFQLGPSNSNAAHLEGVSGQIRFWSGSWGAGTFMAALNTTGLGLGTSAPGDELHLYTASANTNIGEIIQNGSRQYRIGIRGDTSNVFAIQDDTAGAIRMVINTAGNLGIGTGSPTFTLDVSGSARMGGNGFFRFTSDADPYAHFGGSSLSGDARLNVQDRNGALISYYFGTTKIAGTSLVNNNALYINMGSNGANQQIALADIGSTGFWGLGAANNSMQYMVGAGASGAHVFYTNSTTGQSNAALGTERMRIAASGLVTIGGGLRVQGTITTGNVYVNGGLHIDSNRSAAVQGMHLQWNRSGGGGESWIINQQGLGGDPGIRFGGSDANNNVTEWMRINNSGRVGIGNTNPLYPLHVAGGASNNGDVGFSPSNFFTYYIDGPGVGGAKFYTGTFSARFNDSIIVTQIYGTSDQRIKKDIADIDDPTSLTILRNLQPKTYHMIDHVATPGKIYGFIAQEVETVLPDAVTSTIGVIPNVYDSGIVSVTQGGAIVTLSNVLTSVLTHHNIVDGTLKVDVILSTNAQKQVKVLDILDDHSLLIETDNITFTENETVFVYGQEVNDYKAVHKDVIYAVTTAAVQEIDRQLESAKETIASQQDTIATLVSEIQALKARLDNANL